VLHILCHQNIHVILSDILNSDQSKVSELISLQIEIESGKEVDEEARDFTASIIWIYRKIAGEVTLWI
jgi:hypothetical protein